MRQTHKRFCAGIGALAAVFACLAGTASPALAQSCKAPPGMSAIDQYCEAIPGPGGERGNSDHGTGAKPIPATAERALTKAGADGRDVLALSAGTAGSAGSGVGAARCGAGANVHGRGGADAAACRSGASGRGESGVRASSGSGASGGLSEPSPSVVNALAKSVSSSGDTAGSLFGTTLLLLTVAFFGFGWVRYRGRRAAG
jgi:hypothetical protein